MNWGEEEISKVQPLAQSLTVNNQSDREKAISLYNYVRDEIKFGFTSQFDVASPSETIEMKKGHCNPKASLLFCLMKSIGMNARINFVPIYLTPLLFFDPNKKISEQQDQSTIGMHAYIDVFLDSKWISIDGYVLDRELFEKSQGLFKKEKVEGLQIGYFTIHSENSTVEWNGTDNSFCQFVTNDLLVNPDSAPFEKITCNNLTELSNFYNSRTLPTMHKIMQYLDYIPYSSYIKTNFLFKELNDHVQNIRSLNQPITHSGFI